MATDCYCHWSGWDIPGWTVPAVLTDWRWTMLCEDTNMPKMTKRTNEELRSYIHGLFFKAEKKNKTRAWMMLCALRRAYQKKSVPLYRGALDALINLANS